MKATHCGKSVGVLSHQFLNSRRLVDRHKDSPSFWKLEAENQKRDCETAPKTFLLAVLAKESTRVIHRIGVKHWRLQSTLHFQAAKGGHLTRTSRSPHWGVWTTVHQKRQTKASTDQHFFVTLSLRVTSDFFQHPAPWKSLRFGDKIQPKKDPCSQNTSKWSRCSAWQQERIANWLSWPQKFLAWTPERNIFLRNCSVSSIRTWIPISPQTYHLSYSASA